MDFFDMIYDKSGGAVDNWNEAAFALILNSLYSSSVSEEEYDKLLDDICNLIAKKTELKEDEIDWVKVDEDISHYLYNLTIVFSFDEIKKLIYNCKLSDKYGWEELKTKNMNIEAIHEYIINSFKYYLDSEEKIKGKESLIEKYKDKK